MFNLIESVIMNKSYYVIIGILLIVVFSLVYLKRKPAKKTVDKQLILTLKEIFPKDNVIDIQSETSRVKFTVKNIDEVDLEKLKGISNGVFVSQNNIKVMFKDNAVLIVKALGNYYKVGE